MKLIAVFPTPTTRKRESCDTGSRPLPAPPPPTRRLPAPFRGMLYSERMSEGATPDTRTGADLRSGRFRIGAAVALAIIGGLILWLALRDSGGSNTSSKGNASRVTVDQLRTLAAT